MPVPFARSFRLLATLGCYALTAGLAGCATEQLASAAPRGVDLSGEWRINPNLSDDPEKPPVDDAAPAGSPQHHRGGAGHGGGNGAPGGGGYGLPGGAGGRSSSPPDDDNFTGASTGDGTASPYLKTLWQGGPGSPAGAGAGTGGRSRKSRRAGTGHLLDAPDRMTIAQSGGKVTIRSKSASGELLTDEYTFGEKITVPFGDDTAERSAGWRGSIFVVDTKAKKGPEKESDYAIDDDGRLIMATLLTGSHMPKGDIKRVYDRVKAGGPE